jgi:hypothetical protein
MHDAEPDEDDGGQGEARDNFKDEERQTEHG